VGDSFGTRFRFLGDSGSGSLLTRALVGRGLVDPTVRKRRRSDYKRWERSRAMELWQMDIMGGVRLSDGSELKVVTGIDDHSRFCVSARLVRRATAKPVCDSLAEAMRRHGVPRSDLDRRSHRFRGGSVLRGSGEALRVLCRTS